MNKLRNLDLFSQGVNDNLHVRTLSGAAISILSIIVVFFLIISEFSAYMTIRLDNDLVMDLNRTQPLPIHFDITFPSLPCAYLSIDAQDIAGSEQLDVQTNILKQRLDRKGKKISDAEAASLASKAEIQQIPVPKNFNGCGSCFGAESAKIKCCETCLDVREAYREKGWAFNGARSIPQCVNEGYADNLISQKYEGCQISGELQVKKVAGNFHIAPGSTLKGMHGHSHDVSAFNFMESFNLTHSINLLSFGAHFPGKKNPLDGMERVTTAHNSLFQYYVKVVSTTYTDLEGYTLYSSQYSSTQHYQAIDNFGSNHDSHGNPGVYFYYDLSPVQVNIVERSQSFASFITGLCAIIGGIFIIFKVIDQCVYQGVRSISHKIEMGKLS